MIWKLSDKDEITLKDSYNHVCSAGLNDVGFAWRDVLWYSLIPPSQSILFRRLIKGKISTDDALGRRGVNLSPVCSLCYIEEETRSHLYFSCKYSKDIWSWLGIMLDSHFSINNLEYYLAVMKYSGSKQCKVTHIASCIAAIYCIWQARNSARFQSKHIQWMSSCSTITSLTRLAGNSTFRSSNLSIKEFVVLKNFSITIINPKPQVCIEILWSPPIWGWRKCIVLVYPIFFNG